MYDYTICTQADEAIFHKQCKALEKAIEGISKKELLQDVDGSFVQCYSYNGKEIDVYNDLDTDAVYVKSEIDLLSFFENE